MGIFNSEKVSQIEQHYLQLHVDDPTKDLGWEIVNRHVLVRHLIRRRLNLVHTQTKYKHNTQKN